jgi:pimeloyl-ACP methyl ester carboxylesterase
MYLISDASVERHIESITQPAWAATIGEMSMSTVNINGTSVYYHEAGAGEPLLLIPGTAFTADVWDKVFDALARDYRTIAYDRRAYQRSQGSPPPTADYTRQQGKDIAALLQSVNAVPANLLGWSAGCIYALYATLIHPNCARRLLLYEPPLYLLRYVEFSGFQTLIKLNVLKVMGRKQAAIETFLRSVLVYADGRNSYDHLSPELRAQVAANTNTILAELAGLTRDALKNEPKPALISTQVRVPVTILVGEQAPLPMNKAGENLARILHNAPIIRLPESSHLAQIDQPDRFVEAVHGALAQR